MDNFKYKYWDEENCEIVEWDDEFFYDTYSVTSYSGCVSYIKKENLMQFSGVLDCNLKEIYRGDLVKVDLGGQKNRLIEVEFSSGAFGVRLLKKTLHTDKEYYEFVPLCYIDSEDIELLGNKFTYKEMEADDL